MWDVQRKCILIILYKIYDKKPKYVKRFDECIEDFSIIQLNPNAKTKIIPNDQEGKEIRKI